MSEVKNIPRLRFHEFDSEWVNNRLGDLIDIKGRIGYRGYTTNDIVSKGEGSISLSPSNIDSDGNLSYDNSTYITWEKYFESPEIMVEEGFTILVKTGSSFGKSGLIKCLPEKSTINPQLVVLKPTKINPFFLFTLTTLSSVQKQIKTMVVGGTIPTLSQENISNFNVNIPSLPEQQKIADFLTAVDKRIELLEKKKTLLETYKKGVMKKIFNQEIRFKDDNGNDFPDWDEKRLDEISKFRRGSFPQPYGLPEWYDDINGKPFVQVFDVGENFKLKPQTKQKISSLAEPKSVFVPKESVVITIQGSIGRVAITQYDSYVDRTLLIFKELNGYLDKYFFVYQLYRLFEIEKRRAPGGTIKTITKEKLSSFTIQIPEKKEQLKISNFLFSIDKQLELLDTHIDKSKTWKKGLLQKMFV